MKPKSTKQVIKAIGSDKLELVRGRGYWYFIYDDVAKGLYDTKSVYVMHLRDMDFDQWVSDGREFVAKMERT
jgi:hypothetical protein